MIGQFCASEVVNILAKSSFKETFSVALASSSIYWFLSPSTPEIVFSHLLVCCTVNSVVWVYSAVEHDTHTVSLYPVFSPSSTLAVIAYGALSAITNLVPAYASAQPDFLISHALRPHTLGYLFAKKLSQPLASTS